MSEHVDDAAVGNGAPANSSIMNPISGVDLEDMTRDERAILLHEFGHVEGLLHEHQSRAGGGKSLINPAEIAEYYSQNPISSEQIDRDQIINEYKTQAMSSYLQAVNSFTSKYDNSSDEATAEAEKNRSELLETLHENLSDLYRHASREDSGDTDGARRSLQDRSLQQAIQPRKMTRMEMSDELVEQYLQAQKDWEHQRDAMIGRAIAAGDPTKLAEMTRELVDVSQARPERLSTKYADATVRGYSHAIREAAGHLDVASTAGVLQAAKDAFRASSLPSVRGASAATPVPVTATDWAAVLEAGFTPEDLAKDPELISMAIGSKSDTLELQKKQLALLQDGGRGDAAALRHEAEQAARELERAESDLRGRYVDSTLQLAKIAIAGGGGGSMSDASKLADAGTARTEACEETELGLASDGAVESVTRQIEAVDEAQSNFQQKQSAWASWKAAVAGANPAGAERQQAAVESTIASLEAERVDLKSRRSAAGSSRDIL